MQGGMPQGAGAQGSVSLTPHGIELSKSAAAAGYFADRLRTDERQRSYMTLQQVGGHSVPAYAYSSFTGSLFSGRFKSSQQPDLSRFCAVQVNSGEPDWGLPEMVQQYHSLYPLEDIAAAREQPSQAFGIPTIVLKGVSSRDGQPYTLRRLDSRQAWSSSHQ